MKGGDLFGIMTGSRTNGCRAFWKRRNSAVPTCFRGKPAFVSMPAWTTANPHCHAHGAARRQDAQELNLRPSCLVFASATGWCCSRVHGQRQVHVAGLHGRPHQCHPGGPHHHNRRPLEFVHSNKLGVITQREVGIDTQSFSNALRAALREPRRHPHRRNARYGTVRTALSASKPAISCCPPCTRWTR